MTVQQYFFCCVVPVLLILILTTTTTLCRAAPSSSGHQPQPQPQPQPFVLRIRRTDGSVHRVGFTSEEEASSLTLQNVLQRVTEGMDSNGKIAEEEKEEEEEEQYSIQYGTTTFSQDDKEQLSQTLKQIGIQHGALLTLVPRQKNNSTNLQQQKEKKKVEKVKDRWNPFPELAKDYQGTMRQIQQRKAARSSAGLSFADLSALHESLHTVEPQQAGPIHRLYLCKTAAERFAESCAGSGCRVALLWGTLHRERRDLKRVRSKTSLSSTTESEEYCQVAKVQAIWEPPQQQQQQSSSTSGGEDNYYDTTQLLEFVQMKKVIDVAQWLGLVPVGWMYSYSDLRSGGGGKGSSSDEHGDALPVFGVDVETGARLQMACMKWLGRELGNRFVTVAMHASTGATEAFQLSDVAVQMVAENMFVLTEEQQKSPKRLVTTRHAVLVDGQETTQLDSVLCLVNTALLSHQGTYTSSTNWGVKKNSPYQLTKKTRKALIKAVNNLKGNGNENNNTNNNENATLLELLANFNILVALYDDLPRTEMQSLVDTVRKWARGQKKKYSH